MRTKMGWRAAPGDEIGQGVTDVMGPDAYRGMAPGVESTGERFLVLSGPLRARAAPPEAELRGRWLVRARWVGSAAQVALVVTGFFGLGVPGSWPVLLALFLLGAASNG